MAKEISPKTSMLRSKFNPEQAKLLQRKLQEVINTETGIIIISNNQSIEITVLNADAENVLGAIRTIFESSEIIFENKKSNKSILLSGSEYQKLLQNYLPLSIGNQANESLKILGNRVQDKSSDEKQCDPLSIHYKGDYMKSKDEESSGNKRAEGSFPLKSPIDIDHEMWEKVFVSEGDLVDIDFTKEKVDKIQQIKESLKLGQGYFEKGNFKEAEKELVKAIKPVLSKSSMKDLYVRVEDVKKEALEAMYHLGLIYLNDTGYFNNYAKATGIFQYCRAFAKKYHIGNEERYLEQAHNVEVEFLKSINVSISEPINSREDIESYKEELESFRADIKRKIAIINSTSYIPVKADIMERIYNDCSHFFVKYVKDENNDKELVKSQGGLVQRLLTDCYKQLGNPPGDSEHAIIALGSLALGTMTPWSDLEFAILVNKPEYKEYFRNITKLLQIKVINLGETHLKGLGVESLNNFKTGQEQDEWFWDDVIKIKFNFDSARWDACKVPLGRQGRHKVIEIVKNEKTGKDEKITLIKRDYELILTPDEMAAFQKELLERRDNEENKGRKRVREDKDVELELFLDSERKPVEARAEAKVTIRKSWFESDKHLVQALRSVSLIEGSQALLDEYRLKAAEVERPEILKGRALQILKENIDQFSLKLGSEEEGRLIDSKMEIYRLSDRIINGLSNYYNITPEIGTSGLSAWQMIDKMREQEILSVKGSESLKEALAIATELRLCTYSHNDTRSETVRTYIPAARHLSEQQKHELIEETFHMDNVKSLYFFYYVMSSAQSIIKAFCKKDSHEQAEMVLKNDQLFDCTNYNKAMVCARFLQYKEALKYMEKAKKEVPEDLELLDNLFLLYIKTGKIEKSVTIGNKILGIINNRYQNDPSNISIAQACTNLGNAYDDKGEFEQAIKYHQRALEIMSVIHKDNLNHVDIANIYVNLGGVYSSKGNYDQAIEYYRQTLSIIYGTYGKDTKHPTVAKVYDNLGVCYGQKGDYDLAILYHSKALEVELKAHTNTPNHTDVATSYENLGNAYLHKGHYDKAIEYCEKSLDIKLVVYGNSLTHSMIATSYNNLGAIYREKGDYDKAIEYGHKALNIMLKIYKNSLNHPDIASCYGSLGNAYDDRGDYDQAIKYLRLALEKILIAYENSPNHPDIASCYNNLGAVYNNKGEYDQAIECHQRAHDINLIAHKTAPNHTGISNYNNLGNICAKKGNFDQAIKHYQKALDIELEIHKSSPNHPSIAFCYNNLGSAHSEKKEYDQAIEYFNQALRIKFLLYGEGSNHLSIAISHNNLGMTYYYKKDYKQAIDSLNKALDIKLIAYKNSPNHISIFNSYNDLGRTYSESGNLKQALKYHKLAQSIKPNADSSPNFSDIISSFDIDILEGINFSHDIITLFGEFDSSFEN